MGRQIVPVIHDRKDCELVGIWSRTPLDLGSTSVNTNIDAVMAEADVAIDFTLPSATDEALAAAVAADIPLVCGVSGLSEQQLASQADAANRIPILYDRNMSYGIAVLNDLVLRAAKSLGREFAAEIHETHHIHKIDAPSGTALMLGEALADGRGDRLDDVYFYADGANAMDARPVDAIEFKVMREGEVPGDHKVVFRTASETVSLCHSVGNRRVFAEGAVLAALWLASQRPGRYRMADVLAA